MNESRSRNNCAVLNETSCVIRKDFIFVSDDSRRSNLNFRMKALIKSSFRRLCYRSTSEGCSSGGSESIRNASHTAWCLRKYKVSGTDSFVGLNNLIDR